MVLSVFERIDRGYYRDATTALNSITAPTLVQQLLRLMIRVETEPADLVYTEAKTFLQRRLSVHEQILCLFVIGRACTLTFRPIEGEQHLRQAVEVAAKHREGTLLARGYARLCSVVRHRSLESAIPLLTEWRRHALAAADAPSLAEFHCLAAEVEMKAGRFPAAQSHLRTAQGLAEATSHLRVQIQIHRLKANAALRMSRVREALELIRTAVKLAEQCGQCYATVSSLSSFAEISVALGNFDDAKDAVRRALSFPLPGDAQLALFDTLLQGAIAQCDQAEASRLLSQIDALPDKYKTGYFWLWHSTVRARWLVTAGEIEKAEAVLASISNEINESCDVHLRSELKFAETACLMARDPLKAVEALTLAAYPAGVLTQERAVEFNRFASLLTSGSAEAESYGDRATRIRSIALSSDSALNPKEERRISTSVPEVLASCAALFATPADGQLLGEEVIALVEQSSIGTARLVACPPNDPEAEIAFNTVNCGESGAVLYRVETDLIANVPARLSFSAIKALVSAAREIDLLRAKSNMETTTSWMQAPVDGDEDPVADARMLEILGVIRRVAPGSTTILFTGETGTGKEWFARKLHAASKRADKPFVPFNCSAVSREMMDSQLFGHRRGAFTGAHETFPGVIRAAAGGTLFLDEIGELPLELQPKLLRFLESGEIHPLGESRPTNVDVRVVAATNANVEQLVAEGKFREDLFYRLNVVRIKVPPLRERREEIPLLVQHYLERSSREAQKAAIRISDDTMEYLVLYKWPGNVRQLANEVRRMVALAESGAVLMPEHLSEEIAASRRTVPASERPIAPTEFVVRMDQPLSAAVEHLERSMIQYAMKIADGRYEDAAHLLGVSRKGLYLKRQRLQLDAPPPDDGGEPEHEALEPRP